MNMNTKWVAAAALSVMVVTGAASAQTAPAVDTAARAAALSGQFATHAAVPVREHRGEIMRRVERLMGHQARYLVSQLHPWDQDPTAMLLTDGRSIEGGIRPNAHTICGLAVMAKYGIDAPGGPTPAEARGKAIAMLRFVLPTHGAGGKKCSDGRQWKGQWQSALWAYDAGLGVWLLWDDLDEEMRWLGARMICDEADRFVGQTPPTQVERDTKAEENAWNSQVVALAYNMFPKHPHHDAWGETAKRWQVSSYATASDLTREDLVDGRPVREWLTAANIYDDYTLENHDRVHPDYMSTVGNHLLQRIPCGWGGSVLPQSAEWNTRNVYASLKRFCFPDGGFVYPSAQDWQLHRNADWFALHSVMAVAFEDRQAARMMRICLEAAERMAARDEKGGVYGPGETAFASSQAMQLCWPAKVYATMAREGEGPQPMDEGELWKELAGRHVFESGKFAVMRTGTSVATFSWGKQVMGMVLPIQEDLLLTPCDRGLIGVVTGADGKRDVPAVKQARVMPSQDWLGVAGVLDRGKGALEQRFGYAALPDGRVVYVDVVKKVGSRRVESLDLGTLGVLNDRNWVYHDGKRKLHYAGGERTFAAADATKEAAPVELSSPWYNLDDCLGIVCAGSSGKAVYHAAPSGTPGRLEQLFHLNHVEGDAGRTVLVFYPGQRSAQTADVAARCKVEADGDRAAVRLEDGRRIEFDLAGLAVKVD